MAILLDRNGDNTELQEQVKQVKEFFGIHTESKGDAKAIELLLEWFCTDYQDFMKNHDSMSDDFLRVVQDHTELKRSIKTLLKYAKE
jgi:hypothetical protein